MVSIARGRTAADGIVPALCVIPTSIKGFKMKDFLKSLLTLVGVGAFAALAASPSSAATCKVGKTEIFVEHATGSECGGSQPSYSGSNPVLAEFFGATYTLSSKLGESGEHEKGDLSVGFSHTVGDKKADGTWSLESSTGFESIVFGFKKGPDYFAFLLDDLTHLSGNWTLIRNGKNPAGYSHLDIWYKEVATSVIPLPASALFLLSSIGGIGFLGWRRRQVAATA